jgi:hypothetical protein
MQGELDQVWQHLLPALKPAPLPANSTSLAALRHRCEQLTLPPPAGERLSPTAERISGQRFAIAEGKVHHVSFKFAPDHCTLRFEADGAEHLLTCGLEQWHLGETDLPGVPPRIISGGTPPPGTKYKVAASGVWRDADTFEMLWRYYETPHHDTITCHFQGDEMTLTFLSSIAQLRGAKTDPRPSLRGKVTA